MNLSQESQLSKVLRYHACDASTQTTTMMETMIKKGSHVFRNPQTLEQLKQKQQSYNMSYIITWLWHST